MTGKKPQTHTAADLRLARNKQKYGTVENRDKTSPRGRLYVPPPQPETPPMEKKGHVS